MPSIQENITQWFAQHETSRKFVKGFIAFGIGFLFTQQAEILAHLPSWAAVVAGAVILALHNYTTNNTTLPWVGKKAQ